MTPPDRVVAAPDGPSYQGAPISGARQALIDFAERSPATQEDVDRVMRALVSHDEWYVPVLFADRAWGQRRFDRELLFADAEQTGVLHVFTDEEAALLAQGQAIGVYGGPVPGHHLMCALDGGLEALLVNPASPREHQWYIASAGFDIAVSWATAIRLERALAGRGAGPAPAVELLGHRYHLLLEKDTHALAMVSLPDIDGMVAVCFTAADRAVEFVSCLPVPTRPLANLTMVDGAALFDMLRGVGAAGVVINAGSADQTSLTREDIAELRPQRPVRR